MFIHDALFDHIVCGDTSIAASSLKTTLHELTLVDPKKGVSKLHTEYEVGMGKLQLMNRNVVYCI